MTHSRREFIKLSALGSAAVLSPIPNIASSNLTNQNKGLHISIFSKHLQFLNYEDSCDAAKEIGFDSLDLTVRPKGHVFPENVNSELPKAVDAMKQYGMSPVMFASNINNSSSKQSQDILKIAAVLGFKFYRPAWYKYGKVDIAQSAAMFSKQLIELSQLSKETGIAGSYHNHSGLYYGAPVWDLNAALEQCDIEGMGCQYDIMHNVVEGGKSWEVDFRLIKDKINTLVIKDFKWTIKNGHWDKEYMPMGEGMVDFASYFKLLKKYNINVPISIHYEYDLGGAERGLKPTMDKNEIFRFMKKDLDYVRDLWASI